MVLRRSWTIEGFFRSEASSIGASQVKYSASTSVLKGYVIMTTTLIWRVTKTTPANTVEVLAQRFPRCSKTTTIVLLRDEGATSDGAEAESDPRSIYRNALLMDPLRPQGPGARLGPPGGTKGAFRVAKRRPSHENIKGWEVGADRGSNPREGEPSLDQGGQNLGDELRF
ncbi:hypothetical protein Tco_0227157 [Tanacetum coccineum]